MTNIQELQEEGWHISINGFDYISQNGNINDKITLINNALNTDIKEYGEAVLFKEIKQNAIEKLVLQIQKVRNVAAPKSKEESQAAPRMLKITLTDGHTTCHAIEIESISRLSRTHTPPGAKILIRNAKISSSCILLNPKCCTLLGGRVPALWEKWELAKNVSEHIRSLAIDGPPPWVNFGEKITSLVGNETFKSLMEKNDKEPNDEFNVQRQDAIAVASTGAVKKVFGGGSKVATTLENQKPKYRELKYAKGKREIKEKGMEKPQKPSEKISLFDFLEDKLSVNDSKNNIKINSDNNLSRIDNVRNSSIPYKDTSENYVRNTQRNTKPFTKPQDTKANSIESVTKNFSKMSFDNTFASRSFKQHLNLSSTKNNKKNNSNTDEWTWKVGDLCMAKYWEDGKYYNATITNLTDRTCVVKFNGYGNVEEVLKLDCIPIEISASETYNNDNNYTHDKGSYGYRSNRRMYTNNKSFNRAS